MDTIKKNTCFIVTPDELEKSLSNFIMKKYNYNASLSVHFDTEIWLPVVVEIKEDDSDEFLSFWRKLNEDLFKIKDKHDDGDFELGDKLIQLMLNKQTTEYLFNKTDTYHQEYIYNDDGSVYILTNEEDGLELASDKVIEDKISSFNRKLEPFILKKEDFLSLNSEDVELHQFYSSPDSGFLSLQFSYKDSEYINMFIDFLNDKKGLYLEVTTSAYCSTKEMEFAAHKLKTDTISLLNKKLQEFAPVINVDDTKICFLGLPVTYFEGLTTKESVVLSLVKLHNKNYEETKDLLGERNKKVVDNTLQRIIKKVMEYETEERVRDLFPSYVR